MKTKTKNLLFLTIPSLIMSFLIIEVFLRFVIPASDRPLYYYDASDRILRFDLNMPRMGLATFGNLAQIKAYWRINNYGWNSNIDYSTKRDKPLIAIIGDSYVEALQVNQENNIAAKLREKLGQKYEVYSFGVSGAPLIQYLQTARYVKKYFKPDIVIINVVHNDFDESLGSVRRNAGMVYLNINNKQITEEICQFKPNKFRRLLRLSSLVRYFYFNVAPIEKIKNWFAVEKEFNANIKVNEVIDKYDDIVQAIDYILAKFKEEKIAKTIVFMMDAPRHDIYDNKLGKSNIIWMNNLLKDKCEKYNFYFIDLTTSFLKDYQKNHKRFESIYDDHWNEYGHEKAAEALYNGLENYGLLNQ